MANSVLNLASAEPLLASAVDRSRADSTNTTTTDSSRSGGEEESDHHHQQQQQHHHRTERLLAESKGLAALVGALSLDASAALAALIGTDSESVSDSHKNAKNTLLAAGQNGPSSEPFGSSFKLPLWATGQSLSLLVNSFFYSNQTLTYSYVNKQEKMRRVWELSS